MTSEEYRIEHDSYESAMRQMILREMDEQDVDYTTARLEILKRLEGEEE